MKPGDAKAEYFLGNTDAEQDRLIRQAKFLAFGTDRFFREAGIESGQHVLDVGSGVGDVAMLASRIVGPSGKVTGIERDIRSVDRARARAAEAGLKNIRFVQTDIADFSSESTFDAVVGRYILQFLPDPVGVLRRFAKAVRPGGAIAFQENSWKPFLALSENLPLWSAGVRLMHEAGARFGVNLEMGPMLHKVFWDAGLPAPQMRLEMVLSHEPEFTRLLSDAILSVRRQFEKFEISIEPLGDLETLQERLQREVASSQTVVPWIPLVGAWCRTASH